MPAVIPESMAERIIAGKIREWTEKRKNLEEQADLETIKVHPFLTIARDFGSGEEEILPKLEKTLQWKIYGRNLLDFIAQRELLSRSFMETLDEQKQNLLDNWVNFLVRSRIILQNDYVLKISRLMKVIVAQESAILLGRGAHLILKENEGGLRIKLTAPFDRRVQNIMKLKNISKDEAEKMVLQKDKERQEFLQRYFNKDTHNAVDFDIIFNTQNVGADLIGNIAHMILDGKTSHA
ncbi:MAG: AAA family ATPase [Nitrospinales bacterium]